MNPETIYSFITSILVIGLLYFILYNAVNNSNYMKKGLIFLGFGMIIVGVSIAGVMYDLNKGITITLKYLAFPITNLVFLVIFSIYFFTSAAKFNHKIRSFKKVSNDKVIDYLYLVFRYEDFYLLDGKDNLRGVVIKFDKNISFHDEMLNKFLSSTNTKIIDKKFVGKVMISKKRESIYYCYKLEALELSDLLRSLSQVNKFEIYQKPMHDFDKEVILKMLISKSTDPFIIKK